MSHQKDNKHWSKQVTDNSRALELEPGVFTFDDPKRIAQSLKRSAEASKSKKASAYRSAMSMLTFYINRAGDRLDAEQKQTLELAKQELKFLFGRS